LGWTLKTVFRDEHKHKSAQEGMVGRYNIRDTWKTLRGKPLTRMQIVCRNVVVARAKKKTLET